MEPQLLTQPRCACCGHELLFRDEMKAVLALRAKAVLDVLEPECGACGFGPLGYDELARVQEVRQERQNSYARMTIGEVRRVAEQLRQESEDLKRYAEELAQYAEEKRKRLIA